jgi:hypothetical protein
MNKKTQMYLGIGVLAVAAYYLWEKSSKDKANDTAKANAVGVNQCAQPLPGGGGYGGCWKGSKRKMGGWEQCKDGSWCISKRHESAQ